MSFLFANSGDFRSPSLDEQFERALASVRRMAQDYATAQNKELISNLATAIADRDRLDSQFRELRAVLQEARLFVGNQALGQSRTHKADALLKLIVDALNTTSPTRPARSSADDCAQP